MQKLLLPRLGQTMEEGTVVDWLMAEGDDFAVGDDLYEVENDKAMVAVEATIPGRLARILVPAGETVPVGTVVAVAGPPSEPVDAAALAQYLQEIGAAPGTDDGSGQEPAAQLAGAGALVEDRSVEPRVAQRRTVTGRAKAMARSVTESWVQVPQFQQSVLVDVEALARWREALVEPTQAEHGFKPSLNDVLLDRVVAAIADAPQVNATFAGEELIVYEDVNVAVAIASDRGLAAPVIHRAQAMSLGQRGVRLRELAARTAAGELTGDDVTGATITMSNLGMHGVENGFALVTAPQAAIVFLGSIAPRAVVVEGAVVPRLTLHLSVTYDHRVVDGAAAAAFLAALRRHIEEPHEASL